MSARLGGCVKAVIMHSRPMGGFQFLARVICVSCLGPLSGTSRRAIFDFVAIAVPLLSYATILCDVLDICTSRGKLHACV